MKSSVKASFGFALSLVAAAMMGCSPANEAPKEPSEVVAETQAEQSETERLNAWFEEQYEEGLKKSPLALTMQGRKERYGELDQMSEQASNERFADMEAAERSLEACSDI